MIHSRLLVTLSTVSLLAACEGTISDGAAWEDSGDLLAGSGSVAAPTLLEPTSGAAGSAAEPDLQPTAAAPSASSQQPSAAKEDQDDAKMVAEAKQSMSSTAATAMTAKPAESTAKPVDVVATSASLVTRVGAGDMKAPALGPGPIEIAKLTGDPYVLVKNWDFGSEGTVRDMADLDAEFNYHDHFGTIANGVNYGSVTAASSKATAIGARDLGLPGDQQPVEDPAHPVREFTKDSMLAHVLPLSPSQQTVSAARHDAVNGSLTAKWSLPSGGELLGHDLVWETRVRMPTPVPGYWFAVWTAGKLWNKGAEMDVMESFGAPHIAADAFHSDSVGGTNLIDYKSWPATLNSIGVVEAARELPEWHTWTWVYLRDDSYDIYYDGFLVQHGNIHWTHGAKEGNEVTDMHFLFDFSWGHTQVPDVNIELPASDFPLTYEIDYSRVYMR